MLGFDNDILQHTGLRQLKEHAEKSPFLLDVTHKDGHTSPLLQGAKLLHHAVIHSLNKALPGGDAGEIKLAWIVAIAPLYFTGPIHHIRILDDIPVWRMPEDELRALLNVGVQQVKPAVQIVGMADDPHGACGIGGSIAAAHIVTDLMQPEMGDQIFDQFGGAVAAVAIVSALSPLRIGYDAGQSLILLHHLLSSSHHNAKMGTTGMCLWSPKPL